MIGTEIAPGLRRWTAFHPKWKAEVASLAVDTADGLVLVDPLLGDEGVPQPQHVLITVHWHVRSTPEIAERWPGTRVWAMNRKGKPLRGQAEATDIYARATNYRAVSRPGPPRVRRRPSSGFRSSARSCSPT